jgi:hypothetical protein
LGCLQTVLPPELLFDAFTTPALRDKHKPSIKAMLRAANAMLVLASDPNAQPQHPSVDLTAEQMQS